MATLTKTFADKLVKIAAEQFRTGYRFKEARMVDIQKNEEFYIGRKIKVPKGRFGVPLPTMSGFVDTLMSKIDDAPILKFGYQDIADLKIARKTSAMWQKDSHPNKANWALKDRWAKKLACFSGRPVYKIYSESDPKYKNYLEVVDYEDFITEPMGGGDLNAHLFCGQDNIFKTDAQIKAGVEAGRYDVEQVKLIKDKMSTADLKKTEDIYSRKKSRMESLGLNLHGSTYIGQPITKFIEWAMEYEGTMYYLLFELFTETWIRAESLKDVFKSNLIPWVSWATHEDPFNFWSKAPCDDMRPIADSIDTIFNQALDNRSKINFGQRAYDPKVFPDPSQLEWRPDGLVMAKTGEKGISSGIYEFKTPEITGSIDMIQWLNMFLGEKIGIRSQDQGAGDEKVGIYFGNLQQMADRLGLYNKSYRETHLQLGLRYAWGLSEHLTEKEAVKIIGEEGVEWTELTRGEAKKAPDLDIEITGGSAELMANEAKKKQREGALGLLLKRQDLTASISPNWLIEQILSLGSYEEAEIKTALSKDQGSLEMQAEASQSIQMIMDGKKPKMNRGATTTFIQKIVDFATDNDMEMPIYNALMAYAKAHVRIAIENMTRAGRMAAIMAQQQNPAKPMLNLTEGLPMPEPSPGANPMAGISGGRASSLLSGKSPSPALE